MCHTFEHALKTDDYLRSMHTHTLFELNEHIRRILALNFQQPVWIVAEVAQIGESRGHRYLDLVQKGDSGDVIAQAQAALWAAEFRQINAKFPFGLQALLREGLELRLQVRPEFHERYGLKYHITDIDPAHTFGQLDLLRRQTIQALREQGLYDLNRAQTLPLVLQRIAVISSETAAGKQDFQEHLQGNSFGYAFDCQYFTAAVQGKNAAPEVIAVLKKISQQSERFDCVVIVRGGGSKLDLMAFDDLELCQIAAKTPLPLLVGIGHDIDQSVLDMVAHTSLKTPTAVADFLVQHNLFFEGNVLESSETLENLANNLLNLNHSALERAETTARMAAQAQTQDAARKLDFLAENIPVFAFQTLREHGQKLSTIEAICHHLNPQNVLQRGYSITTHQGKPIAEPTTLASGDLLETQFYEGRLQSKVI
ncbi:MAG: exodeoxyribonuclease VII large subunit [Saprospiraceae bacterium]|nr:exodeoxyribonuclease VII large subunit [Saprospiraceae bacterium]